MNEPNKKLTLVVRIVLAAWGLILGWWFAGFILGLYPEFFKISRFTLRAVLRWEY